MEHLLRLQAGLREMFFEIHGPVNQHDVQLPPFSLFVGRCQYPHSFKYNVSDHLSQRRRVTYLVITPRQETTPTSRKFIAAAPLRALEKAFRRPSILPRSSGLLAQRS